MLQKGPNYILYFLYFVYECSKIDQSLIDVHIYALCRYLSDTAHMYVNIMLNKTRSCMWCHAIKHTMLNIQCISKQKISVFQALVFKLLTKYSMSISSREEVRQKLFPFNISKNLKYQINFVGFRKFIKGQTTNIS